MNFQHIWTCFPQFKKLIAQKKNEVSKKLMQLSYTHSHMQQNLEYEMLAAVYHKGDHGEYCLILKWESRFTLGLNAAKITNYIKKIVQIESIKNWISYTKVSERSSLSPLRMELGLFYQNKLLSKSCKN